MSSIIKSLSWKNSFRDRAAYLVYFVKAVTLTALLTLLPLACSHDDDHNHGTTGEGKPTGSMCPQTQTLTYTNFGKAFMEGYCVRCHSSELKGDARMGATEDHDFNTLEGVQLMREHIDEQAGSGPNATNTLMPKSGTQPTVDERKKLSEWLACGAP